MSERHSVEIKYNPEYHDRAPATPEEELVWPYLDTVWDLIRELAGRMCILNMRVRAEELLGVEAPTERELLDRLDETCVCGKEKHTARDITPDNKAIAGGLLALYGALVTATEEEGGVSFPSVN